MRITYLVVICVLLATSGYSQSKKKKGSKSQRKPSATTYILKNKEDSKFLEKQWWIGLKAGVNWTRPTVTNSFSVLSPNYDPTTIEKKYESMSGLGVQTGLEVTFYFKRLSLTVQPTYQSSVFRYGNEYFWSDSESTQHSLELNYEQEQKMEHLVLPLMAKFDLTTTKVRPYVALGVYSAILINATKSIQISGTDNASGGVNEFTNEEIIVGAKDLFAKNYWGLLGGVGANYQRGNVRINLEVLYQYGMSNAVNAENRYSNDRLVGVGDAMDDLTLDNLVISLGCLFPLRFLEDGFKSVDKKK